MTDHNAAALLDVLDAIDNLTEAARFLRRHLRATGADVFSIKMAGVGIADAVSNLDGARYHIEKIEERCDP